MKLLLCIIFLFESGITSVHSSRILAIFPAPCQSHNVLGESLLQGLVTKGHHVTMISPYPPKKAIANYTHVKIEGIEYVKKAYWSKFMNVQTPTWEKVLLSVDMFPMLYHIVHNNTNVQEFVEKRNKYDLCIVSFLLMESMFAICNAVKAPAIGFSVIGLSPLLTYLTYNPVPYAYVPNPFLTLTHQMSFVERLANAASWISFDVLNKLVFMPYHSRLLEKYYPDAPQLEKILDNVDLYLLNSHSSTDSPKALLPNIIPIGGFHLQITEDIPADTKAFLDGSKNGVIYFNLGTNIQTSDLDYNVMRVLLETFTSLNDFDVLWKYDGELSDKPRNVRTEKWLPQRSILMHPKVKVFITHGGLGGTVEAIYGGVPMICMPVFADQFKNCAESANGGFALLLNLRSVTNEVLIKSIRDVATNSVYKEKAMLKSDMYRNQEVNPMERAIFWIEHVIRHKGAKHLRSQATNLAWYQYYLLDVFIFLSIVMVIVICIIMYTVKMILKICSNKQYKSTKVNCMDKVKTS